MQRLLYLFGLLLLAGLAPAQVHGPWQEGPSVANDTMPWVFAKPNGIMLPPEINDSTAFASDSVAVADSCDLSDCLVIIQTLYPRFALNDSILRTIEPPITEYSAEFRKQPPPPPHIRPVVAESEIQPLNRERRKGWLFTILTLQFVLIVYLRVGFTRYAGEQYRSFFNLNISQQVFRDQELSMPFPALLLTINGILSYAILLYLGLNHLGMLGNLNLFAISLGAILGIAAFKYLLMWFTSAIFPFRDELNFYNFNFFLNIKILGTLLLPINFIIAYAPPELIQWAVWAAVCLLALAYLALAIKGLAIAKNYLAFYKFHFIVYICSLEIAPVLIFVKLVMNAA